MGKLDGKVAVITSGSTGVGRGIGEAFLAEGGMVVINGRDVEKGARALKEMNAGERGHFIRGDVTIREDIDAVVDGAVEKFGRIDILVNNAGGLIKTAPVAGLADEDWDYAVRATCSPRSPGGSSTFPRSRASTASPRSPRT